MKEGLEQIDYTFIKIWNTQINCDLEHYDYLNSFISKRWQLILISEGSLTRHINILQKNKTRTKLIVTKKTIIRSTRSCILFSLDETQINSIKREVWLTNSNQTLIFAQSYWLAENLYSEFNSKKPIGEVCIDNEINMHRELQNIYYGYCKMIEKEFGVSGPLWGRSYLVYFNQTPALIIHEIFSPYLVKDIKIFQE